MNWLLLRDGPGEAAWNMALDEALLENAEQIGHPILRFYGWVEPAATFGYSQHYEEIAARTRLRPLIRRITGGGLVPHDADWTYSLIVPPGHAWFQLRAEASYRQLHEWVAAALNAVQVPAALAPCGAVERPGECFAGAEKFDVLAAGRKIAGAAQKRNKLGLLVQGSVQPHRDWDRNQWEEAMLRQGERAWEPWIPPEQVLMRAQALRDAKYARPEHNRRR